MNVEYITVAATKLLILPASTAFPFPLEFPPGLYCLASAIVFLSLAELILEIFLPAILMQSKIISIPKKS